MIPLDTWVVWNGSLWRVVTHRGLWAARRHDQQPVFMHTGYDLEWGTERAVVDLPLRIGQHLEPLYI